MSALVDFLMGVGPDGSGRRIGEVLAFDDAQLERRHDFIQWLFPLPEPSRTVPGSPVLLPRDVAALKAVPLAGEHLRLAAARMLVFYANTDAWLRSADHNHLRITRIVRSLRLLAGDVEADAFRDRIWELVRAHRAAINPVTLRFWVEA